MTDKVCSITKEICDDEQIITVNEGVYKGTEIYWCGVAERDLTFMGYCPKG